jgi:hypothetical protein
MTNKTNKKITNVGGTATSNNNGSAAVFVPTAESKARAKQLRLFAALAWLVAIGAQVAAILLLFKQPLNMTMVIVLIAVDLVLVIVGSMLWKKSNRLDPASEKDKFKFFVQNQLGVIISALAFLPLVVIALTNKNLDGKQKGIIGGIAGLAFLIAGISSVDFNPPSVEQYTEQTQQVEQLNNGKNLVYWTKSGTAYHLFSDCSYINTNRTTEIFEGTVAQARELKNITNLCNRCEGKAIKANNLPQENQEEGAKKEAEEPAVTND